MKLLAKIPEERFESAAELVAALRLQNQSAPERLAVRRLDMTDRSRLPAL